MILVHFKSHKHFWWKHNTILFRDSSISGTNETYDAVNQLKTEEKPIFHIFLGQICTEEYAPRNPRATGEAYRQVIDIVSYFTSKFSSWIQAVVHTLRLLQVCIRQWGIQGSGGGEFAVPPIRPWPHPVRQSGHKLWGVFFCLCTKQDARVAIDSQEN